jgi:hypothetical protein
MYGIENITLKKSAQAISLLTFIPEMSGSNLACHSYYPDSRCRGFPQSLKEIFSDST